MKKRICFIINLVLSLALAVVCGYVFFTRNQSLTDAVWSIPFWYIGFLLISILIVDFVHELGHIIVGNLLKMGVGFPKIRLFNSSSVSVDPKTDKNLKGKMIATALAGIVFTCLLIVVGTVAIFVPAMPTVLVCLLPYSFYLTVNNSLPFVYDGDRTDGLVAQELLFNTPEGKVLLALLTVVAKVNLGTALKDVDEQILTDLPQLCDDDAYFYTLTMLRAEYYESRGEEEKANIFRERLSLLEEDMG